MAELVIAAMATATSAVGSLMGIGGTVAGAAGASASALGGLSGTFSAFSAFASLGSGVMGMMQAGQQAQGSRLQAAWEQAGGADEVADLMEARNRTIANNMTMAAASGIDTSVGDPQDAARQVEEDANRQIGTAQANANMRRYMRQQQASQSETTGFASLIGGVAGAAKELASSSMSTARRGVPQAA